MAKNTYKDMEKYFINKRASRKKYYAKTQNASNSKKKYTDEEIQMILEHKVSDRELSEMIGRSMKAIQRKREVEKQKLLKNNE